MERASAWAQQRPARGFASEDDTTEPLRRGTPGQPPPTFPAAFTQNPCLFFFFPFSPFLSKQLKAQHQAAAAKHPRCSSLTAPRAEGCLPLLCTYPCPKTPAGGQGFVPLPITHTPQHTFCAGPTPPFQHPFPPTEAGEGGGDAGRHGAQLEAPSPLTLPSPGAAFTPPPHPQHPALPAASLLLPPHPPQNAHVKDPEARWASLKCTSTGSCPVRPRHTKARWPRRTEGVSPR